MAPRKSPARSRSPSCTLSSVTASRAPWRPDAAGTVCYWHVCSSWFLPLVLPFPLDWSQTHLMLPGREASRCYGVCPRAFRLGTTRCFREGKTKCILGSLSITFVGSSAQTSAVSCVGHPDHMHLQSVCFGRSPHSAWTRVPRSGIRSDDSRLSKDLKSCPLVSNNPTIERNAAEMDGGVRLRLSSLLFLETVVATGPRSRWRFSSGVFAKFYAPVLRERRGPTSRSSTACCSGRRSAGGLTSAAWHRGSQSVGSNVERDELLACLASAGRKMDLNRGPRRRAYRRQPGTG